MKTLSLVIVSVLISGVCYAQDESKYLFDALTANPKANMVHVRVPLTFDDNSTTLDYLKPQAQSYVGAALGFIPFLKSQPRGSHDLPGQGDTYCEVERAPNAPSVIEPGDYQIQAIHQDYDSDTGAFQGTRIDIGGPVLERITCESALDYKKLDVPSVQQWDGSPAYERIWDGERPTIKDFRDTFQGDLDVDL